MEENKMNRKIFLWAFMSTVLVSISLIVPAIQTSTNAVTTATKDSPSTFEEHLLSIAERLPEHARSHLTKMALIRSDIASNYPDMGLQTVQPSEGWGANITVGRFEYVWLIVDKSFASVKPKWEVAPDTYYVADSLYLVEYYIEIANDTDPQPVTLTDTWMKKMAWGVEGDVSKSYYLLDCDTNIQGAGPGNYNPATGVLSITFDPDLGPSYYYIGFIFLAKTGFVNQFISKPGVSHTISPKTTPNLITGRFYDMWLRMKSFKVRGLPLEAYVWMEVPGWQSTENCVYIKNMDPQTASRWWHGADPPDVPGPVSGGASWDYPNLCFSSMPLIDPSFPDHWIQVAFQKSDVTPGSNMGNFLYCGGVGMVYANKGFGIVIDDTPQLTLSPGDWDISVTTGLEWDVISVLDYYFEEPKPTTITLS
jgi:hypothetical protein